MKESNFVASNEANRCPSFLQDVPLFHMGILPQVASDFFQGHNLGWDCIFLSSTSASEDFQ
jgi:hypothetical protein